MKNLLKKFIRNRDGNIAIMAAAMVGPMVFAVAIGMDVAETYRAKTNFQSAVDAAALSVAKIIARRGDHDDAKDFGEKVFYANLRNLTNTKSKATVTFNTGNGDCADQGIVADATLTHPTHFGATNMFFDKGVLKKTGINEVSLAASSTVNCGSDSIEVVMVLDNSGSMGSNDSLGIEKMVTLKSAAKGMVNTLHDSMQNSARVDPVSFSLVPFSNFVNVGPSNKNASWMDKQGLSSIHHEHLNWEKGGVGTKVNGKYVDSSNNDLTRFTLYDEMGISWRGCVEQRPYPYHLQDDTPTTGNPDTLIVPAFAPDAPDDYSGATQRVRIPGDGKPYCSTWNQSWFKQWYRTWWGAWRYYWDYNWQCTNWTDGETGAYHSTEGYAYRPSTKYNSSGEYLLGETWVDGGTITEEEYYNNYIDDDHNMPSDMKKYDIEHTGTGPKQYSRQKWTFKYFNYGSSLNESSIANDFSGGTTAEYHGGRAGPNYWCNVEALTPLTASRQTALDAVDDMIAKGGTNIPMGVAWGWRALSPSEPLSEGRAETDGGNRKIMIVMTDGNNTSYAIDHTWQPSGWQSSASTRNPVHYGSHGHNGGRYGSDTPVSNGDVDLPERMFVGYTAQANPAQNHATYTAVMDSHMITTCNNAKANNIQIYAIAFDVDNGSPVQASLQACASQDAAGEPLYYNATDSTKLQAAFDDIAERIAELSITK